LRAVPVNKVKQFESEFLSYMNLKHRDALDELKSGKLTDNAIAAIESSAKEVSTQFA
jgi:F-type H+-transporting ATPase subunit alpha